MNTILPHRSSGVGCMYTDDPEDVTPQSTTTNSRITTTGAQSESSRDNSKSGFIPEFDDLGDELGKEARVWKVYVEETDKWDADLVNKWDRSLDVILVFAALFSAISTAFLIESSTRLREDPADTSAENLVIITRTLLAMANNTRPPDLDTSFSANRTTYQPSRASVLINALWYLSLSLSVAASLLAMLAKEWCHSFMSGRIGDPFTQARRRQQKWNRIEYWRMRQVLAALPSLMHLALLLFAIGLCIDVWETNVYVASPVLGITLVSAGFYTWCSLMGIWVDNFPYTTTISRTFRSKTTIAVIHQVLQWSMVPLGKKAHSFFHKRYMRNTWPRLLDNPLKYLSHMSQQTMLRLKTYLGATASNNIQKENPGQDEITSLALGWLIKYCEVPRSVDVALQAIAGASARLPRRPLKHCNAAVLISRRLASDRLHKETKPDTRHKTTSLYLRALSFLNPQPSINHSETESSGNPDELEGMVLDLQFENERRVAAAFVTGSPFVPDGHNLTALRIGSLAASQSLTLLRGDQSQKSHITMIQPILRLLQQHNQGADRLHPAACLSLINAAILFSACSVNRQASQGLASVCMKILYDDHGGWSFDPQLAIPLIVCALMQRRDANDGNSEKTSNHLRFLPFFRILIDQTSSARQFLGQLVWLGAIVILTNSSQYGIDEQDLVSSQLSGMLNRADKGASFMWDRLGLEHDDDRQGFISTMVINRIQASQQLCNILKDSASGWESYMFATTSILRLKSLSVDSRCWSTLSRMGFPKLSTGFSQFLERREILQTLGKHIDDKSPTAQFIAATQLWLLCVIALNPPVNVHSGSKGNSETRELLTLLKRYASLHDEQAVRNRKANLGRAIENLCQNTRWIKEHNFVYVYRVLECVLQSRDCPSGDTRWTRIATKLATVPQSIRGLDSFTNLQKRLPIPNSVSATILGGAHYTISVDDPEEK